LQIPKININARLIELLKSRSYKIKNLKTGNVIDESAKPQWSNEGLMKAVPEESNNLSQEWIIYPLDNGKFIIANRKSGEVLYSFNHKVMTYDYGSLFSDDPETITEQQFTIESTDTPNYYKIKDIFQRFSITEIDTQAIFPIENDDNDANKKWMFIPATEFKTPERPTLETLISHPKYQSDSDNLPAETLPQLIGWTLIPAPMIKDNIWFANEKIYSAPYYVLENYQYWKRVESLSLAPGETRKTTYRYGITNKSQTSMNQTLGMTITEDSGLKFSINIGGGITNDSKKQITENLKIHESTSIDMKENIELEDNHSNPNSEKTLFFTKYTVVTKLVLKRRSQNLNDLDVEVNSWEFLDPNQLRTTSIFQK